jgi:hypothetical protein
MTNQNPRLTRYSDSPHEFPESWVGVQRLKHRLQMNVKQGRKPFFTELVQRFKGSIKFMQGRA